MDKYFTSLIQSFQWEILQPEVAANYFVNKNNKTEIAQNSYELFHVHFFFFLHPPYW